jgi:glutathione S-transferase
MAFYGSSFEPAVVDHAMKRPDVDASTSPYGSYERVMETINQQLARADYLLGEHLTAVDILWGTALKWTTGFGIVPVTPVIRAYIDRVSAHPAFARAAAADEQMNAGS